MPKKTSPVPRFYSAESYTSQESLGWLLRRLTLSIVHQADARLAQHGLTHAQWGPMLRLRMLGETSVAALVRDLQIDAGALTRLLDRLEAKGLCARRRSDEDRRVVMVSLTAEGERQAAKVPQVLADVFNKHLVGVSEAEWRLLVDLLQRMVANGDACKPECRHLDKNE